MIKYSPTLIRLLCAFSVMMAVACNKENETDTLKTAALNHYANLVLATYDDSYTTANDLKQTIDAFVANPTEQGFNACKTAWLAARIPYGQTEAFRFYGGPIDDESGPEGLINAWPMDENFIDYVDGAPNAGLINSVAQYPDITIQVLKDLNESISETSIFTGYHAIEFLLWGQDFSIDAPGQRPYTDYVTNGTGTASNQARSGQYLKVVAALLLDNLDEVRKEWVSGGAYRTSFLNNTPDNIALGRVFTALGALSKGELAGERMFVAIDTKDQENEHSCFSDNTLTDIKVNFLGIKNVYFGTYTKIDGTTLTGNSFNEIVDKIDPDIAAAARTAFEDVAPKIDAIPAPFDQTIVNNPLSVTPAIEALRALSNRLVDAGKAIGAEF